MMRIRIPVNASAADLESAYAQGMLKKEQLKHGAYYKGFCRNTSVARWSANKNKFFYIRKKFDIKLVEGICHPEDDSKYDVFVPVQEIEPDVEFVIRDVVVD